LFCIPFDSGYRESSHRVDRRILSCGPKLESEHNTPTLPTLQAVISRISYLAPITRLTCPRRSRQALSHRVRELITADKSRPVAVHSVRGTCAAFRRHRFLATNATPKFPRGLLLLGDTLRMDGNATVRLVENARDGKCRFKASACTTVSTRSVPRSPPPAFRKLLGLRSQSVDNRSVENRLDERHVGSLRVRIGEGSCAPRKAERTETTAMAQSFFFVRCLEFGISKLMTEGGVKEKNRTLTAQRDGWGEKRRKRRKLLATQRLERPV